MFRKFFSAEEGTIAILAAIIMPVLFIAVGMMADVTRWNRIEAIVQEAADTSALMGLRDINFKDQDEAAAKITANRIFDIEIEKLKDFDLLDIQHNFIPAVRDDEVDRFVTSVTGSLDTTFLRFAGINSLDVAIVGESKIGVQPELELALVVDSTGSMRGSRELALKTAASEFINGLLSDDPSDNVGRKIGIVPFNDHVNVGRHNRAASWIDVPADRQETTQQCQREALPGGSCRTVLVPCLVDGLPNQCPSRRCTGPSEVRCVDTITDVVWRGCVGSRSYPNDTIDANYLSRKVPGLLENDARCPLPITPLTNNKRVLTRYFDRFYRPGGETYLPSGLLWGVRLLSSQAPFDEGLDKSTQLSTRATKAIIFMTDGANVKSPIYPKHDGSVAREGERLFSEICDNAKQENIDIYTIAFEVTDLPSIALLADCATSREHFFNAQQNSELIDAFSDIQKKLQRLAIAR